MTNKGTSFEDNSYRAILKNETLNRMVLQASIKPTGVDGGRVFSTWDSVAILR